MDQHKKNINKLCRLCGNKVVVSKGYLNPKTAIDYKDIISNFFKIDVTLDDLELFPPTLCNTCKKKLDASIKADSAPKIELFPYDEHSQTCSICYSASKSSKSYGSFWKFLDAELSKINFVRYVSEQADRIFYRSYLYESSVSVDITLKIHQDYTWDIYVFSKKLNYRNSYLKTLPTVLDIENVKTFIETINCINICIANPDFKDVIDSRLDYKEPFFNANGTEVSAFLETSRGHSQLSRESFDIIRDKNCVYLVKGNNERCSFCRDFRTSLHSHRTRLGNKSDGRTSDSSKTNFANLSREELIERCRNTASSKHKAVKRAARLSSVIADLVKQEGVMMNNKDSDFMADVFNDTNCNFEENTPMWLLWQQQKTCVSKSRKAMRWHPLIIRWCLSIYLTSPAAYRQIANTNNKFMMLPHINTLKKYINFTKPTSGFNVDILERLIEDSKIGSIEEYKKNVSLSYDEMKIQSNLVYKKSSGKLVGFVEMGDTNTEIRALEQQLEGNDDTNVVDNVATYVNVFMVRGIFSKLAYPFGYHSSQGFTGFQLVPLVWEATRVLEGIGFKVRSWVCDGATPNRKCFKINAVLCDDDIGHWTVNHYGYDRKVFFISDAPHLLKTTRNNVENSHGNRNTKNLHVEKQDVSWNHIVEVYEWDLGLYKFNPGLRLLHKLKEEHIKLSPRHRMRVKFAVQVLSSTMANAMRMHGKYYTKSTEKFIRMFDRAFDCLNVTSISPNAKPDLRAYTSINDERFEFLESVLTYLDNWREQVNLNVGMTKEEKSKLCISLQTDFGWHLTIKSFVKLAKLLLEEEKDAKFLLSEKFSQDPLEEHFARHRRIGGSCDNPSLDQFKRQEVAINVMRGELINDLRGNSQSRQNTPIDITDTRLPPKRKR